MTETSAMTHLELEIEYYELLRQKIELINLLEEATDWDWLGAKEEAAENNSETLDIEPMQKILDKLKSYKNEN